MTGTQAIPSLLNVLPFAVLLLCIACLPIIPRAAQWWEKHVNKLALALLLSGTTLFHYFFRGYGLRYQGGLSAPGVSTALALLEASLTEYIPFIIVLFALFVISGGVHISGDLPARPRINTVFLAVGAVLSSIIGTTGASMLLIRPLLHTNRERVHKAHTVCFFIFLVSNIGGLLTPLGDPPLFLGYLLGVPFNWTLFNLWRHWLTAVLLLLAVYFVWDTAAYRRENITELWHDETRVIPIKIRGWINLLWLTGLVLSAAFIDPERAIPFTEWHPFFFLRELVLLGLVAGSLLTTPRHVRAANGFSYGPILEVAVLFLGIFVTMQTPIEILRAAGPSLGLSTPAHFFWLSGALSSFLDNAPTYAVFFQTAGSLSPSGVTLSNVSTATGQIALSNLAAISVGAVFMGANSYIGNGPNFMVKSIAEASGVKMPSFFGYMLRYSIPVLLPLFAILTFVFF